MRKFVPDGFTLTCLETLKKHFFFYSTLRLLPYLSVSNESIYIFQKPWSICSRDNFRFGCLLIPLGRRFIADSQLRCLCPFGVLTSATGVFLPKVASMPFESANIVLVLIKSLDWTKTLFLAACTFLLIFRTKGRKQCYKKVYREEDGWMVEHWVLLLGQHISKYQMLREPVVQLFKTKFCLFLATHGPIPHLCKRDCHMVWSCPV